MRLAAYLRVSTLRQAEDGVSIDMQKNIIINQCRMLDLIHDESEIIWYTDDGWSAKNMERPAMRSLIKDIEESKYDILISYDMSRISREINDMMAFLKMLDKYKVELKCIYDDPKFDTAGHRFVTTVNIASHQYEREKTSERTRDAVRNIAESGRYPFGGMCHYGYRKDKSKFMIIDPREATIVRRIFDMAIDGYRVREIAEVVNTMQDKDIFDGRRVRDMILNRKYSGVVSVYGKEYTNLVPAIVSPEVQQKAIDGLVYHNEKSKMYIFSKVLVCQKCNEVLRCTCGHGYKRKTYFYYYCKKCGKIISQTEMDDQLKKSALSVVHRDYSQHIKDMRKIEYGFKNRITLLKKKYISNKIDEEGYNDMSLELNKEIDIIKARIAALEETQGIYAYKEMENNEQKRLFIEKYINKIVVNLKYKSIVEIQYKEK